MYLLFTLYIQVDIFARYHTVAQNISKTNKFSSDHLVISTTFIIDIFTHVMAKELKEDLCFSPIFRYKFSMCLYL